MISISQRTVLMLLGGALALSSFTACQTSNRSSNSSEVKLLNGKNLDGWRFVSADPASRVESTWSVRDGVLVCTGAPVGFIRSEREFTNFRMIVEYRWPLGSAPGNSGIFSRINGPARALPRCVEVQLQHGNAGDILGLQGMEMATNQERLFEVKKHELAGDIRGVKKLLDAEKSPGEWNRVEIVAQGPAYTVWINGQKVNFATGIEVLSGPVGLQSEGGSIQFRRVSIIPQP